MLRTFALTLLVSLPAQAASLVVETLSGVDLRQGSATSFEDADVQVLLGVLRARSGCRIEGSEQGFSLSVPVVLNQPYLCRRESGAVYRMTVLASAGNKLFLEVRPADEPAPETPKLQGRYRMVAMSIDGLLSDAVLGDLNLYPDGTYRLGSALGHWEQLPRLLSLGGYYGVWGPAEIQDGGRMLVFRFRRGGRSFEAIMVRQESAQEQEQLARSP